MARSSRVRAGGRVDRCQHHGLDAAMKYWTPIRPAVAAVMFGVPIAITLLAIAWRLFR